MTCQVREFVGKGGVFYHDRPRVRGTYVRAIDSASLASGMEVDYFTTVPLSYLE